MNKKVALIGAFLLGLMVLSVLPVRAWVYYDDTTDSKVEFYGPHISGILIHLYADEPGMFNAMLNDEVDFEDWPVPPEFLDDFQARPEDFIITPYGGEAGYFILDINNNATLPDGSLNPAGYVDTSDPYYADTRAFRQAIAYCVNRTHIVYDICEGLANPMWTPVPTYMTTYVHPEIKPGGLLEELTYGGWEGDPAAAEALLDANHFPRESPDGYRYWDRNRNGVKDPGEDIVVKFYSRSDSVQRLAFADDLVPVLDSIGIKVDYHPVDRWVCYDAVMIRFDFTLYTGGWIFIGPDPDYLFDLYHSSVSASVWGSWAPNYDNIRDPVLDDYLEHIKFATTFEEAKNNTLWAQERFAGECFAVPLWCASGYKVVRRNPVEDPTATWNKFVNEMGFGLNSYWSFMNLRTTTDEYPPIRAHYGFSSATVSWLNPIYAEWYWDWEIIGKIYDGGAARNPYNLGEWVPQLFENWEVGTWVDPEDGLEKSKVRFTIRDDAFWMDGTPVTSADVFFTQIELPKTLVAKGLPAPWWYTTVAYFKSFYIIDAYNIEVLLDVKSVWAVGWVIGSIVLPKHIWKPILDASTVENPIIHDTQPDPNMIGTGPFRFVSYTPGSTAELVANVPGSEVNGIISPGCWQYLPVEMDDYVVTAGLEWKHDVPWDTEWCMSTTLKSRINQTGQELPVNRTVILFNPDGTVNQSITEEFTLGLLESLPPVEINQLHYPDLVIGLSFRHCDGPCPIPGLFKWTFIKIFFFHTYGYLHIKPYSWTVPWTCVWVPIVIIYETCLPTPCVDPCTWWWHDFELYWPTDYRDIGGSNMYDDLARAWSDFMNALPSWQLPPELGFTPDNIFHVIDPATLSDYPYKTQLTTPDFIVDIKDIFAAAKAYGAYPGHERWNPVTDVNGDYYCDIKDIFEIAKGYGQPKP